MVYVKANADLQAAQISTRLFKHPGVVFYFSFCITHKVSPFLHYSHCFQDRQPWPLPICLSHCSAQRGSHGCCRLPPRPRAILSLLPIIKPSSHPWLSPLVASLLTLHRKGRIPQTRVFSDSQRPTRFWLSRVGIKGRHQHTLPVHALNPVSQLSSLPHPLFLKLTS